MTSRSEARPRRSWLMPAACGLVIGLLLAAVGLAVLSAEGTTVVRTTRQPPSVVYSDGSAHYLAVKRHVSVGSPLIGGIRYELWLGRDPELQYGHSVAVAITGSHPERFDVDWTGQGVKVHFASGHEIFVPATSFVGGR